MKDDSKKNEITIQAKQEAISEGIAFLLEMEQVSNKPVQNALILNILKISNAIKDVDILADQEGRKMLIYLKLGAWGRFRHSAEIEQDVISMLQDVLPNFTFRVIYDYMIFQKGLEVAKKLATLRAGFGPRM